MSTQHTFGDWNSGDWKIFAGGITEHQAAVNQETQDNANYQLLVEKFQAMRRNPEEALLYFLAVISASTQPNDSANILGLLDDQMGITGKSLLVTAQATQLINDIENITNCTATKNPDGSPITLQETCADLDKLLDAFNPAGPQDDTSQIMKDLNAGVQKSFDPEAIKGIFSQLQTLRQTIHLGNGDPYDPTGSYPGGYYFDPTGNPNDPTTPLSSFQEMQADLSQKGNPKDATGAQKALSDALSVLSSTTQGVNSALNEQVSQQTGFEKNVQSFVASLMKSLIDLINSIVQTSSK